MAQRKERGLKVVNAVMGIFIFCLDKQFRADWRIDFEGTLI